MLLAMALPVLRLMITSINKRKTLLGVYVLHCHNTCYLRYLIRKACKETQVWGEKQFSGVSDTKKCYIFDRVRVVVNVLVCDCI